MQHWLEPLNRQSATVGTEVQALRQTLQETLAGYKILVDRLEEAARRGDALYESLAREKIRTQRPKKLPGAEGV